MNRTSLGPIDRYVGSRIAVRRKAIGMSQETLAGKLGLTLQQIRASETGRSRVGIKLITEMAGVLGVDLQYFYDGLPSGPSQTRRPIADLPDVFRREDG